MMDLINTAQQQIDQDEEKIVSQLSQSNQTINTRNFYYAVFTSRWLKGKEIEAVNPKENFTFDIDNKRWMFIDEGDANRVAALTKDGTVRRMSSAAADTLLLGTEQEKAQLKIEARFFEMLNELPKREDLLNNDLKYSGIDERFLDENPPKDYSEEEKTRFNHLKKQRLEIQELKKSINSLRENIKPEEKADKNKFHFQPISELLQKPSKIKWLIKSYLDAESLSVLVGEPGSMKSFVALDLGLSIATGIEWHGSPIRQSGSVFYIAGEGHHGLSRRLKAWTQAKNIHPDNIPFFVSNKAMQVLDNQSVLEMITCVDDLKSKNGDPLLIIIDTLNRNFGNGDENNTKDMTTFVSNIDTHIRSRFNCAVLIVHHTPLSDSKRGRGASSLHGATDWEFLLSKSKDGKSRILENVKTKDHEPPPKLSFVPQTIQLDGWMDEEENTLMTSCVLKKCANEIISIKENETLKGADKIAYDCLLNLIREQNKDQIDIEHWRKASYDAEISSSGLINAKKQAFRRAYTNLQKNGYVECVGDHWQLPGRDKSGTELKQGEFFK